MRPTPPRDLSDAPSAAVVRSLPVRFEDDAQLVEGLRRGHPAAARALWDRQIHLVRGLLRRTMGPRSEVEDAVQEVFLRLYRRVDRLRDPGKLQSFVVGVTVRVAREQLRYRRVRRWLRLTDDGVAPEPPPERDDHGAAEALAALYTVLDRIDADTRLVFVLRFVEQIPTREIAEVLGCSLATAKRRVARAEKRILSAARTEPALAPYVQGGAGET